MKYLEVKKINPYINGVVGQDINLTLIQKIKILFCKGISVALIGSDVQNKKS